MVKSDTVSQDHLSMISTTEWSSIHSLIPQTLRLLESGMVALSRERCISFGDQRPLGHLHRMLAIRLQDQLKITPTFNRMGDLGRVGTEVAWPQVGRQQEHLAFPRIRESLTSKPALGVILKDLVAI